MKRFQLYIIIPYIFIAALIYFTNPIGNFPLNDDWQYAYPVKTLLEKGQLEFQGVFAPNVLLQIIWGFLFCKIAGGFDFTWLRFSTLAVALLAAWAFFKLCYQANKQFQRSYLAGVVLTFNPLFYVLAFSFMSDVPFLALTLLSLVSFYNYLQNYKNYNLILATLSAIAAFYIRQPGILLLLAFAIFLLLQQQFSRKAWMQAILLGVLALTIFLSLEWWLKPSLKIDDNYVPVGILYAEALFGKPLITALEWVKKLVKTFVYLGVFGLPLLPFLWKVMRGAKLFTIKIVIIILLPNILLLLFLIKTSKVFPFGGNVWYNWGLGPQTLADVYTLGLLHTPRLPDFVMLIINLIGQISASLLLILIIKRFRDLNKLHQQFIYFLLLINGLYLMLMSITSFFDRYLLLPTASFIFILTLLMDDKKIHALSLKWLPLLGMSLFSILATKDYLTWNRVRYEAFEYLQSQKISIREIDAGYELNGFYNYRPNRKLQEGHSFWWINDDRWMITFGAVPGYESVKTISYYRWLYFKNDALFIIKRKD